MNITETSGWKLWIGHRCERSCREGSWLPPPALVISCYKSVEACLARPYGVGEKSQYRRQAAVDAKTCSVVEEKCRDRHRPDRPLIDFPWDRTKSRKLPLRWTNFKLAIALHHVSYSVGLMVSPFGMAQDLRSCEPMRSPIRKECWAERRAEQSHGNASRAAQRVFLWCHFAKSLPSTRSASCIKWPKSHSSHVCHCKPMRYRCVANYLCLAVSM